MNIPRRKFIQHSSASGVGLMAGMPALGGFFEDIPPAEQNFIPLCGIYPNPDSVGGNGIHLRWSLPPSKGVPESIVIYRRKSSGKATSILLRPADSGKATLPSEISDVNFLYPNSNRFKLAQTNQGKCYENTILSSIDILRIDFDTAVDFCRIQLGVINPITIKGYYTDGSLASVVTVSTVQSYASFSIAGEDNRKIKYIEIPLNLKYFYFIEYFHQKLVCDLKDWEKLATINNETDIFNAANADLVYKRITQDSFNYYLPNTNPNNPKRAVYQKQALYFKNIMRGIKNPSTEHFIVQQPYMQLSDIPPNELIFKNKNSSKVTIKAWGLLMLHALDPNIARMLGLYFVDTTVKDGQSDFFDYKVVVAYKKTNTELCGIVQNISKQFAARPTLKNNFTATQVSNTRWEFDTQLKPSRQLGKVRLTWPAPEETPNVYNEPVVYALRKDSGPEKLISPGRDKNPNSLFFVDQEAIVSVSETKYEIRGIDLFGQVSDKITSALQIKDRDTPPPPYKLTFSGNNDNSNLLFEYGASQYLAAPDAKSFTIYKKEDTIISSREYRYTLDNNFTQDDSGNKIRTLLLQDYDASHGNFQFVRFIKNQNGQVLPATSRKKFKIDSINSGKLTFTCGIIYDPAAIGFIECVKDPLEKSNNGWVPLTTKSYVQPLYGGLLDYTHFISDSNDTAHFAAAGITANKSFTCEAMVVRIVTGTELKDLFETAPVPATEKYTEVLIDRQLFYSGLFTRCRIDNETAIMPIIQSSGLPATTAGLANAIQNDLKLKNKFARIIIRGEKSISVGAKLHLQLEEKSEGSNSPNKLYDFILARVSNNSILNTALQGELLLKGKKTVTILNDDGTSDQTQENILATAMVGSDFSDNGEVLLFLDKKIQSLTTGPLVYFRPYVTNINSVIQSLHLAKTEAHRSLYFAVDTIDKASPQHSSPLSIIAQFIKTRNKNDKPQVPQRPFPCGQPTSTEAFLNPSNREGHSTFCIEWIDIRDVHGVSQGYRYEIGRALDKTIIATHRDLWLKGKSYPAEANTTISITGLQRSSTDSTTGIVKARFINDELIDWNKYKGGRLTQGSGTNVKGFEIINLSKSGSQVNISLRPMIKGGTIQNGAAVIDLLPDYKKIHDDPVKLNEIINDCPGAFSIVTGQPLRNATTFLDTVPGTGSSRFFYKVRSVDASELRSDWSPASVAIWQVDITPPEPLINFTLEADDRQAKLQWSNTAMPLNVKSFELFRLEDSPPSDFNWLTASPYKSIAREEVTSKQIVAKAKNITLPSAVKIPVQGSGTLQQRVTQTIGSLPLSITTTDNMLNLYDPLKFELVYETADADTALVIRRIKANEDNVLPASKALKITIGIITFEGDPSWMEYIDTGLTGGKKYFYVVRPVKKVRIRNSSGVLTEYSIKGKNTNVLQITGIDRSDPQAPVLDAAWADAAGNTISSYTGGAKAKLTIDLQGNQGSQLLIQRNDFTNDEWKAIKINNQYGWIEITGGLIFFDPTAGAVPSVQFRAYYKTADNRISIASAPITLTR